MTNSNQSIAIIDYQLSNMYSVKHALSYLGFNCQITSNPQVLLKATAAILPGVGAFGDAIANLHRFKLIEPIKEFIKSGRPFMGVCLGMQLLFDESTEFGRYQGLGLISGRVKRFPNQYQNHALSVPQIGWNSIYLPSGASWPKGPFPFSKNPFMYFIHSYYCQPQEKKDITCLTNYGGVEYCSGIWRKNIFAVQFHPEKSGWEGLKIYKEFFSKKND
jgi:glutamine amidotransferase